MSLAMLYEAPGRFSMMTGWPTRSARRFATSRGTKSPVPGADGTTRRIGRPG